MYDALMRDTTPEYTGHWRNEQVWVGGGSISRHAATFVPHHHTRIPSLMADVLAFAQRADAYFRALTEYRAGNTNAIITAVAKTSFAAAQNGRQLVDDIQAAVARWDHQVIALSDSSVHRIKQYLLRQPHLAGAGDPRRTRCCRRTG